MIDRPLPIQIASADTPVAKPEWLSTLRELVRCYQAFEACSAGHIRTLGLTPSQFDIIVTLGNTSGMTCKELSDRTLITKGTLTGVLDRLERKGLLSRHDAPDDGRSFIVRLTTQGQAAFQHVFPAHLAFIAPTFGTFSLEERRAIEQLLARLRARFSERSISSGETSEDC